MKLNRIITLCAIATTLAMSAGTLFAQDTGNNDNNGGQRRNRQGGPGGPGGGNFDPAQMQQRMVDRAKEELNYTNDTEWNAVQPLIKKVVEARFDVGIGNPGRMFGGRNRGNNNGDQAGANNNRRNFGPQPSPEAEALQKAIDDNAPTAQIKAALAKYQASQKAKQAKLIQAQETLRKVLTPKQEAQAALLGLVE